MNAQTVKRAVRRTLWPALAEHGFSVRGAWAVWRHVHGHTDVVDVTTIGRHADAAGCTTSSLNVFVASVPAWVSRGSASPNGEEPSASPRYWEAPLRWQLSKTLAQPWFRPFGNQRDAHLLPSVAAHREGLRRVLRSEVHDRPDIWYVLEDGSNLVQVLDDVLSVLKRTGLPMLDRFHDAASVIHMILANELPMAPDSPTAQTLIAMAERGLT